MEDIEKQNPEEAIEEMHQTIGQMADCILYLVDYISREEESTMHSVCERLILTAPLKASRQVLQTIGEVCKMRGI